MISAALENDVATLVTADHGNVDEILDEKGKPNPKHSCNPVPCVVIDKLKNLEIDGLVKKPAEYPKSKGFIFEKDSKRILEMFFAFDGIEKVPNEVFCYAIDQYKDTQIRNFKLGKFNDYRIQTVKGEKYPQDEDEIHYGYYMSFVLAGRREIYMTVNIMSYADTRPLSDKVEETIRRVISF